MPRPHSGQPDSALRARLVVERRAVGEPCLLMPTPTARRSASLVEAEKASAAEHSLECLRRRSPLARWFRRYSRVSESAAPVPGRVERRGSPPQSALQTEAVSVFGCAAAALSERHRGAPWKELHFHAL